MRIDRVRDLFRRAAVGHRGGEPAFRNGLGINRAELDEAVDCIGLM